MDDQSLFDLDTAKGETDARPHARSFSLVLLGQFALLDRSSGARIPVTSRKARALLAYLVMAPRCTADRATLAALLWGDSGDDQARQSLRQSLSSLRRIQVNGDGLLQSDDETVQVACELVDADCLNLLQLPDDADIPALRRVCTAYQGAFAAGLEGVEPAFDDWLRGERQRVMDRAIVLHDRLVKALERNGQHQEALVVANALLAINPIREETHRLIIALEAVVSGRAAAMQRFETFRLLLRDELAVRPEPATLKLIDQLRDQPGVEPTSGNDSTALPIAGFEEPRPSGADAAPHVSRRGIIPAAGGLLTLVIAAVVGMSLWVSPGDRSIDDRRYGRALVALAPISGGKDPQSQDLIRALTTEASLAFSRNNRVTLIEFTDPSSRRPDYRINAQLVSVGQAARIDVNLMATGNNETIWSGSIPANLGPPTKFARELYGYVTSEIVLHQARLLAQSSSVPAKLWRARAAKLQTRLGTEDLTAITLYKEVLAEDPTNIIALLELSDCFILRVARNQSPQRAEDIAGISDLLIRVKPLVPNSSDIAFKEGMLNKLQGNFQQALGNFEQSVRLDPAHWNAAAQYAHITMFLGRLQEGYRLMQAVTPNLLPDIGAAETAYIAGETALVAGHYPEAAQYLGVAVSGNPTVGRIQALYAVALFRANRLDEARAAAEKARQLSLNYTPESLGQRGGRTADPRYVEARNQMVEAFRAVRALK
jgi:DNA-binding SARP family transcriptional activator